MANDDAIDVLKRARTAAKTRFTNLRKSLITLLENSSVVPAQKIYAGEKKLEGVFDSLNEAHSEYVAAKYSEEEGLQEMEYMDEPLAERLQAEAMWTKWHNDQVKESQELLRVENEETRKRLRAEAIEDEERQRANTREDLAARTTEEMAKNKESLTRTLRRKLAN